MAIIDLYNRMGGEEGVRRLIDVFYDHMDALPEARLVRALHPPDLAESRAKLFMFLSGWSGGPNLYIEKYGHPRLRMRHMPFSIGEVERDQWMLCMRKALDECIRDEEVKAFLDERFSHIADFMRNQ
ncbi:MAG: group II truncated hemoglobin [Bdellovibrionales bacterium]|nr:group II truncated hemoglobin [Bdellovibrionales bacterium]